MQNIINRNTQIIRSVFFTAFAVLMLTAFVRVISAQSSSFEHPIPLDSMTLRGNLNGSDNESYYSFAAGTNKTEILFEVSASGVNAGATFDLFDKKSRAILSNILVQGVNRSTERQTQTFRLGRSQEVILRVKGIRYGSSGGQGTFMVKIGNDNEHEEARPKDKEQRQPSPAKDTQNSSWDHPIALEANERRDELDGGDDEKFFAFTAKPGMLKVLFEVQASGTNSGATFDIFDTKHRSLLSNILVQSVNKSTEREERSIRIAREQKLILRVQGTRYGSSGGQGVYLVRFSTR